MEKYNAIRVSDKIERIFVDFSSLESLNESVGFERLYTIHTAETNELTKKLGFHVGGFCDDRGRGGSSLAAQIAGYPSLPSDLILCLMDNKYNFLPLDHAKLEKLYHYLTTGEVKNFYNDPEVQSFFDRHNINPLLPNFSVEPKISLYEQFPTVVLFEYDFNDCSDDELEAVGENAFHFASHQLETVDALPGNTKNVSKAKNGKYFTRCQFLSDKLKFFLAFQAIIKDDDKELLSDFVFDPLEKIRDLFDGDAPEEVMNQDYEEDETIDEEQEQLMRMGYILEVEIESSWPNSPDDYSVHFKYCYPLLNITDNEMPFFPDFSDFIINPSFDVLKEVLTFDVDTREKKERITIRPDETIEIKFDYFNSEKETSRRIGKVKFYLRHIEVEAELQSGKILMRKELVELRSHRFLYEEEGEIEAEDQRKKAHSVNVGESFYTFLFSSIDGSYHVLMAGDSYVSRYHRVYLTPPLVAAPVGGKDGRRSGLHHFGQAGQEGAGGEFGQLAGGEEHAVHVDVAGEIHDLQLDDLVLAGQGDHVAGIRAGEGQTLGEHGHARDVGAQHAGIDLGGLHFAQLAGGHLGQRRGSAAGGVGHLGRMLVGNGHVGVELAGVLDELADQADAQPVVGDHGPFQTFAFHLGLDGGQVLCGKAGGSHGHVEVMLEIGLHVLLQHGRGGKVDHHVGGGGGEARVQIGGGLDAQLADAGKLTQILAGFQAVTAHQFKIGLVLDETDDGGTHVAGRAGDENLGHVYTSLMALAASYSMTSSLKTTGRMPSLQQLMQVLLPAFSQRPS